MQTRVFYTLTLQTGMRKGELCGLKWEDFDPRNRTLIVQRSHIGERDFDPLIKKAGVKRIKFHGLRHTAAMLALLDGMPVHVVAEMLGHKDATETVRTYAHVIPSARQEAAMRMAAILGNQ